jgi:hypothetical protein
VEINQDGQEKNLGNSARITGSVGIGYSFELVQSLLPQPAIPPDDNYKFEDKMERLKTRWKEIRNPCDVFAEREALTKDHAVVPCRVKHVVSNECVV